jgi:hypothetical protein
MKKTLTTLFFLGFTSLCFAQKSLEATIRALDSLEAAAFIKQDYAALDTLWATDLKVNNPRNTISLSATETGGLLKKGFIKHLSMARNIEQLFIKGDNMVVVMGNEVVQNTATEPVYKRRYSNFWMKEGNSWKLTFRHANIMGDAQLATTGQKELRHVVLFKFKDGVSADSIKAMQTAFKGLVNQITVCKKSEYGLNDTSDNLNQGFTHSFAITFASDEDRNTYLAHPEHGAFIKQFSPIIDKICMAAFWAERAK